MNKLTVGEYFGYLMDQMTLHPEITNQPLYSPEGILFGFEDHEDTARRFGMNEYELRVIVNQDMLEGIKSNDHLIIFKEAKKPDLHVLPNLMEGFEDDDRYTGLVSE